jgi:hypothetical protein
MTSKEILAFITEVGIVPIVRTSSAESAILAVEAIYAGDAPPCCGWPGPVSQGFRWSTAITGNWPE